MKNNNIENTPEIFSKLLQYFEYFLNNTCSNILEIKSSCEKVINETMLDMKILKLEHESIREDFIEIRKENERLNQKLAAIKSSNSLFESARDDVTVNRYSADIINMLQDEIMSYKAENDELRKMQEFMRKTIEHYEKENKGYRERVLGDSNTTANESPCRVKELSDLVKEKDSQLNEKNMYIETLENQKQMLLDEIELLQNHLNMVKLKSSQLDSFEKSQQVILAANQEKISLQKSLQQATLVIAEHMEKERVALQKMGEALGIAEAAFYEKEEVLKNKLILEKEREFLAVTIGQVMEEASQKVDSRMLKMRHKLKEYEQKLEKIKKEHKTEVDSNIKAHNCLQALLKASQEQQRELIQENESLKSEREVMRKALDRIGTKMQEDNEDKKIIENLKSEIQHLNQKCRFTVDDITQEFQKTVKRLSNENAELKAQLKMLDMSLKK